MGPMLPRIICHLAQKTQILMRIVVFRLIAFIALVLVQGWAPPATAQKIFVSLEKGNHIAVLDASMQVIKRIPTGRRPRDMHFNADRTRLYVACGDDDRIDVINLQSLDVIDHIATGRSPEMFALSSDGQRIYVTNEERSTLGVIDVASKRILQDIKTATEPEGVAIDGHSRTAFVASEATDLVQAIDLESGEIAKAIVVGTRPRRFVFAAGEKELWVANELSADISIIDVSALKVAASLKVVPPGIQEEHVTPVGMARSPDGQIIAAALGRANHVALIDVRSRRIRSFILVGHRPWGVEFSRDGRLFVTNGLSDDLSIIDVARARTSQSVPVGRTPHTVRVLD